MFARQFMERVEVSSAIPWERVSVRKCALIMEEIVNMLQIMDGCTAKQAENMLVLPLQETTILSALLKKAWIYQRHRLTSKLSKAWRSHHRARAVSHEEHIVDMPFPRQRAFCKSASQSAFLHKSQTYSITNSKSKLWLQCSSCHLPSRRRQMLNRPGHAVKF